MAHSRASRLKSATWATALRAERRGLGYTESAWRSLEGCSGGPEQKPLERGGGGERRDRAGQNRLCLIDA